MRWNPTVTVFSHSAGIDRRRANPGDELWVDSWDEELWLARAYGLAEGSRRPRDLNASPARAGDDNDATAPVPGGLNAPITKPGDRDEYDDRRPCGLDAPIACAGIDNGATAQVLCGLDAPITRPGDDAGNADSGPNSGETQPTLTRLNCAGQFDSLWHGGHEGEGNYATTSARSGALRRGASQEQMNGTAWESWTDVPRTCLPGTPAFKPEASPLRPDYITTGLANHKNRAFADAVGDLLVNGASLGANDYEITGPRTQPNLRSSELHPKPIAAWIASENQKGRLDGPHDANPHPDMQFCGVGAVQKGDFDIDEKCRVITHHSQSEDGRPSLNSTVSKEDASIRLTRIVDAIDAVGRRRAAGHRPVIALADLRSAYRNILVRRADLLLTGIQFPDPVTGEMAFHFDRCLGFGGRRSARTFDALASALHYIIERKWEEMGISADLFHYLDDFCVIANDDESGAEAFRVVCEVFADAGCPVAEEKTQPPCRRAVYLGLTLDLDRYTVSLTESKRTKMCAQLDLLAEGSRPALTKMVAGMAGKLGFADVCFPALRPLINPFYSSFTPALRDGRRWCSPSREMRRAAAVYCKAIKKNPHTPFDAFSAVPSNADIQFSVDAAGREGLGGFLFDKDVGATPAMIHAQWPTGFDMDSAGVSSGLQEVLAVAVAVQRFGRRGTHMHGWTDSSVAVDAIAKGRSPSPAINRALWILFSVCAERSLTLTVAWHRRSSSPSATAADALSRGDFDLAEQLIQMLSGASRITLNCTGSRLFGIKPSSTEMREPRRA